jgi:hypothetical protein
MHTMSTWITSVQVLPNTTMFVVVVEQETRFATQQ